MLGYNEIVAIVEKDIETNVEIIKTYRAIIENPSINQKKYNRVNFSKDIAFLVKIYGEVDINKDAETFLDYKNNRYIISDYQVLAGFGVTVVEVISG